MGALERMGLRPRTTDEKPGSPPGPDDDYWYEALGGRSGAGIRVTPDIAIKASAVFACVKILAEAIGAMDLRMRRYLANGGVEDAPNHPLEEIIRYQPNQRHTALEFWETTILRTLIWGRAEAEIMPGARGAVDQLWPLHPELVRIEEMPDRSLRFRVRNNPGTGGERVLLQEEVLRINGLSANGVSGIRIVDAAADAIGLGLAADQYASRIFSNKLNIGGYLVHPGKLSSQAQKNLIDELIRKHAGPANAHRPMLLMEGLDFKAAGMNAEEAQLIEARKWQVAEVARYFRIPLHMLGIYEGSTKCLPADVEVLTENGPRSIAAVRFGERVWSLGDDGWRLARVIRSVCNGSDDILTIRTENRTLRANARHRVLVRRRHERDMQKGEIGGVNIGGGLKKRVEWRTEWVEAGNLSVDDTIISANALPALGKRVCPTRPVSVGFMEFVGLYLGDGSKGSRHVSIARGDGASYMGHYRSVIQAEFVRYARGAIFGNVVEELVPITLREGVRCTLFSSVLVVRELDAIGLSGTAKTKRVPGWVFGLADDLKLAILRGYLDADGSVDKLGRAKFVSVNRGLLSGFWHLCVSLGIPVTNMRKQAQAGHSSLLKDGHRIISSADLWSFTVSDPAATLRIGSHTPHYVERVKAGKPFGPERTYPRFGGQGFDEIGCQLGRIVAIDSGPAEPVYDIEVEGTHSFVANGVVVHNSNVEQQALDFYKYTLRPWLERIELDVRRDLITAKGTFFAEYDKDALLRGDTKTLSESIAKGLGAGGHSPWLTRNEARARDGLNPVAGGDSFVEPINQQRPGLPPPSDENDDADEREEARAQLISEAPRMALPPAPPQPAAALAPAQRADRLVRIEAAALRRGVKRFAADRSAVDDYLKAFYGGHVSTVMSVLGIERAPARTYCNHQRDEALAADDVEDLVARREETMAAEILRGLAIGTGEPA